MARHDEKSRLTGGGYYDEELADRYAEGVPLVNDWKRDVRSGFIRKVYSIMFAQLLVTFLAALLTMMVVPLKGWVVAHQLPLLISSGIGLLLTTILMLCMSRVLRNFPWNYILLAVFTALMTLTVSAIVAPFDMKVVLLALGGTLIITGGLTLFACQTKYDFTCATSTMFVLTLVLFCFGLFSLFLGTWAKVLYSTLALALFSMWLVIDTQLILGGKRSCVFTEDDYILAAISLYTDIVNIFLELHYLLR